MSGRVLTVALTVLVFASACSGVGATPAVDPVPASTGTVIPGPGSGSPPSAASPAGPSVQSGRAAAEQSELDQRLIAAAKGNDLRRARALIRRGADVNAQDDSQQSAYLIATSEGHLELLDLTLKHGADVDAKDSFNGTGLIRAADRGHAGVAGRLIQAGVEVDHVNNLGWTALHEAVILGDGSTRYVDTVRVLVAAGADRQLPDRDGVTALQHAQRRGHTAIADLLQS